MPDQETTRPILFSVPMVRAILEGRKTQTRRVVKSSWSRCLDLGDEDDRVKATEQCPYGQIGDLLWVRETWCDVPATAGCERRHPSDGYTGVRYKATWDRSHGKHWRPSIHMPRWASRITLRVVSVRIERLHEITEQDAIAEGVSVLPQALPMGGHRQAFRALWDELNGQREYAWEANPWVWVVTFEFERHIRPYPPRDGMDWECQCARCGSSTDFQACEECDDGYIEDDWGDDVVSEMHIVACQFCRGHGGYYVCMSSREFCETNPLPCRESVKRGEIEWFRVRASAG